jgi:hypothetical protein
MTASIIAEILATILSAAMFFFGKLCGVSLPVAILVVGCVNLYETSQ